VNCFKRARPELITRFPHAFSKLDERLPFSFAVLAGVTASWKPDPFLAVLFVPRAIAQDQPDAAELEVGKTFQSIFSKSAELDATDRHCRTSISMLRHFSPSWRSIVFSAHRKRLASSPFGDWSRRR
jgi:hypothetical protein